jgi:hypothetical protein
MGIYCDEIEGGTGGLETGNGKKSGSGVMSKGCDESKALTGVQLG